MRPPDRAQGGRVRTGGAPEPQLNTAGEHLRQRAELLGDEQRRVVRQHHAPGTQADP